VITNASAFEDATDTDVVAFDKTGTLTTGRMSLVAAEGTGDFRSKAAAVEQFADHPVARAIVAAGEADAHEVTDFEPYPGAGVAALVDGERVVVGRRSLFEDRDWSIPDSDAQRYHNARDNGQIPAFVGWAGSVRGVLVAGDDPRPGWEEVVAELDESGRDVVVITGDDTRAAARFREHPGVEHVFAGVPPEAKAQVVDRLQADSGTVAMIGDGSNDAPALATADVGISLERGTKLAAEAADAVSITEDLGAVPDVFAVTRATRRRIRQNLGWAFAYNLIALPLAAFGLINPLLAAAAMALSSLLVVLNSSRSLL
jgi:Cu2+-exporting ATPase